MTEIELQEAIKKLPGNVQDVAYDLQECNDLLEKIQVQLQGLQMESLRLKERAEKLFTINEEAKKKIAKIELFIKQGNKVADDDLNKIQAELKKNIELVKETNRELVDIKYKNDVIMQDISIISEDEIKARFETERTQNKLEMLIESYR